MRKVAQEHEKSCGPAWPSCFSAFKTQVVHVPISKSWLGVPTVAKWNQWRLGSAGAQVPFRAWHNGLRIRHCQELHMLWGGQKKGGEGGWLDSSIFQQKSEIQIFM